MSDLLQASREAIREAPKQGQELRLPGFGTFYMRQRQEGIISTRPGPRW